MPVAAKSGGNEIIFFERGTNSYRRCFLPLTLVDGTWHDAFEKKRFDAVLKLPNQEHSPIETKQEVAIISLWHFRFLRFAPFGSYCCGRPSSVPKMASDFAGAGFLTNRYDLFREAFQS